MVVFDCGLGFTLTPANAAHFEVRVEKRRWVPLADGTPPTWSASVEPMIGAPGEGLAVGVRVRYLGGDRQTAQGFAENTARETPAVITHQQGSDLWTCRFDRSFPGCHNNSGSDLSGASQHIFGRYLARLLREGVPSPSSIFIRIFAHTDPELERVPASPTVRCVDPGLVVGKDAHGRDIRIGDRVRTIAVSPDSMPGAQELAQHGHVFTVVHVGVSGPGMRAWLYLDAGVNVGQEVRPKVVGYDTVPPELRTDPTWWSGLAWTRRDDCTIVTDDERRS
ncbi:hypothetical protein HY480_01745, partial [Candidatus Uhrbacteria bacterium]|nr:hypothetical protein [Candidatus Uhrbacteria bacterium]